MKNIRNFDVVKLEGLIWMPGTRKIGQFRGAGQLRGVVNLEGFGYIINDSRPDLGLRKLVTLEGWPT